MTDFVVFPQPRIKKAKLKRIRKRVPKPPRNLKKLGIMLFKVNLFQSGFFISYELFSIQNGEAYFLTLITLLLLLAATFGLILLYIKTEDKLPVFSPSAGEVIAPELFLGFIAAIPMIVLPMVNPGILSEAVKHGIYVSCCAIILFSFLSKSTKNTQISVTIVYLLTVGLFIGMVFQVLHG